MVCPIAQVEATWRRLLAAKSGIARIDNFDVSDLPLQSRRPGAARRRSGRLQSRRLDGHQGAAPRRRLHHLRHERRDPQALRRRRLEPQVLEEIETGVLFGSGIRGLSRIYDASVTLHEKGPRRRSRRSSSGKARRPAEPDKFRSLAVKAAPAVVTACSTRARDWRRRAVDGPWRRQCDRRWRRHRQWTRLALRGLLRLPRLVDQLNDRPTQTSRPYDRDRDGFVMGEGAGCVVLEELGTPRAAALASTPLTGYGLSSDACRITAGRPTATAPFAP